jgi:hypothetical protein
MKLNANQKRMKAAACMKHGGKMTGLISLSTSPLINLICIARAAIAGSICAHCFSRRMMNVYPALAAKLERNTHWLAYEEIKPEDVYHFKPRSGYFRFEAFGDLFTPLQVKNYFTIAEVLGADGIKCALWTKNPQIIKQAIDFYGIKKPDSLNIIFSVAGLNSTASEAIYNALIGAGYAFIDKVFTVFDPDHADSVKINCGARDCAGCGRCYEKNAEIFINEKLK